MPSGLSFESVEIVSPVLGCRAYTLGRCRVIVGREPIGAGGELKWHLSISHRARYPTWDEIREARYRFIPNDVTVAMILPPKEEYVNFHENCFHLHEIEDEKRIVIAREV
jgi:hypothetical protein